MSLLNAMSLALENFQAGYNASGLDASDAAGRRKSFSTAPVSLMIPPRELVVLLGPNGSGKSTLLKGLMGLVPHRGLVRVHGFDLSHASSRERARHLAYLPQRQQFAFPIQVEEIVLMGFNPVMGLFGSYSKAQHAKTRTVLDRLGLAGLAAADYTHLSEGQRQRVLLARSLVQQADILLLDEPDTALDLRVRYETLWTIRTILLEDQRSGLLILHDPGLALDLCDRIELMQDGQIIAQIDPALEPPDQIAAKLGLLYGPLSVHVLPDGRRLVSLEPQQPESGDRSADKPEVSARRGVDA
ncbi:MAG: ABC transporter ATP-binding protein [Clostridia bacterium]|nr:ABC transporter ATP-binding protein [Clostridia bacterium]